MSEKIRGKGSERTPPMCHFNHRDGRVRVRGGKASRGISDDGLCALGDRLRQVAIAIGCAPAKGDKERADTHSPGVILHARNFRVRTGASYQINTAQNAIEM
jgi:hypothetical protein